MYPIILCGWALALCVPGSLMLHGGTCFRPPVSRSVAAEGNGPAHLPGRVSELSQLVISGCFFCHDSHLGQGRGHSRPRGVDFFLQELV